ncbi:uncharacterized protein LOC121545476, partial [Coregonus clupeaformis]|uniref:uncharacterized protein LOC121545476 n=1 Tax=Coregonus clupeaformis TaxID=59861 RepID=UPI001E1C6633
SSLTAGHVPSVFKRARVASLLKKPTLDPSDVNNYRPVSLLSFLSKTLERAVSSQLSCYLSQNDLLDPNQSGFKTGHSTETALLCVTEALRTAKANSLSSALILLDLSAAFDTVNHQILLSTLSELGISGTAHSWIASYLTGRSYQVAWRESVSTPRALTTGVPQGSVLGPLLFSLYTKSLGSVISSHGLSYHCYADDTRRVRPYLTQKAAQVLIQALVISHLDYCNSLLAGLPICAIKPLQLIQNAAASLVFNLPKFSYVTPLLRTLHWLPVEARIYYKTMVLAYGAVRGTAPPYLQALIRPYTQTRALRSSTSGLLAPLPLRKHSSRSAQSKLFAALAPQWWNKLPHDARKAESLTTFRRHLKPYNSAINTCASSKNISNTILSSPAPVVELASPTLPESRFFTFTTVTAADLKLAAVTPVLKKPGSDPDNLQNYRPISNLPFLSKLLECAVSSQLQNHLATHNLVEPFHSGFRARHSTETSLVRITNYLLMNADSRLPASSYCWTSVQHSTKSATPSCWTAPEEAPGPVRHCPGLVQVQFVVIGPNDTQLYVSTNTDTANATALLISSLQDIKAWMQLNFLQLNCKKTEVNLIGTPTIIHNISSYSLNIDCVKVLLTNEVRNLGVIFDSQLSFEAHIKSVTKF